MTYFTPSKLQSAFRLSFHPCWNLLLKLVKLDYMEAGGQQERDFRIVPLDVPRIKEIFGKESKVKRIENGYRVSSVLTEGVMEGGQQMKIELLSPKKIDKGKNSVKALKLTSLKINDVDILDHFTDIYFEVRPLVLGTKESVSIMELDMAKKKHKLNNEIRRQFGTSMVGVENIIITSLRNADDLSALLHEQGHYNDPDIEEDSFWENRNKFGPISSKSVNDLENDTADKPGSISVWKAVLRQEVNANKQQLKLVQEISKKVSLFPVDEKTGFQRLNKFNELGLLSYMNVSKGWFKKQLTNRELSELTRP